MSPKLNLFLMSSHSVSNNETRKSKSTECSYINITHLRKAKAFSEALILLSPTLQKDDDIKQTEKSVTHRSENTVCNTLKTTRKISN